MRTATGAALIQVPCFPVPTPAELLCDELMDHTFVCETCINGQEDACPEYAALQQKIKDAGGITKGIILTM